MVQPIEKIDKTPAFIQEIRQRRIDNLRLEINSSGLLKKNCPFVLEIGSGHGDWLNAYAQKNRQDHCVGIELLGHRYRKCLRKKDRLQLKNIEFFKTEAAEFLEALPEKPLLKAVFILFPDPWPKGKHYERRLIQPKFLELLHSRAHPECQIFFRTDENSYFRWTKEKLSASKHWDLKETVDWPFEHVTFFQDIAPSWESLKAIKIETETIEDEG